MCEAPHRLQLKFHLSLFSSNGKLLLCAFMIIVYTPDDSMRLIAR